MLGATLLARWLVAWPRRIGGRAMLSSIVITRTAASRISLLVTWWTSPTTAIAARVASAEDVSTETTVRFAFSAESVVRRKLSTRRACDPARVRSARVPNARQAHSDVWIQIATSSSAKLRAAAPVGLLSVARLPPGRSAEAALRPARTRPR
jgi:hypothetical protein